MHSTHRIKMLDKIALPLPLLGMVFLLLTACTHPAVPSSLPALPSPDLSSAVVLDMRAMVVGRHPAAVSQASDDLQQLGFTLVQRDRLQQILDEQDPHLNS